MYAIVKTGGKQYKVAADDVIEVEKLDVEPGETVELEVVFLADGSTVTTEADALVKAKVFAIVIEQFKGDKQIIFKFKKRKGYKRLKGHRQNLTKLQIDAISPDGKAPKAAKKATEEKPEKKTAAKKTEEAPAPKDEAAEKKPAKKPAAKKVESDTEDKPKEKATKVADDKDEVVEEKPKKKTTKKSEEDKTEE